MATDPPTDPHADPPTDPHGWRPQPGPAWPPVAPVAPVAPGSGWPAQYRPPHPGWQPAYYGYPPPLAPRPPAPPAEGPSWWVYLVAFLVAELTFLAASAIVVVPFVIANPGLAADAPLPAPAILVSLAVPTVVGAALGIIMIRALGGDPVRDLRLKFGWKDVGIGVACGVSGVIITIPLGALWAMWVGEENANSAVGEIFEGLRMHPVLAALVFLNVWLVAPLCEEILYRGLLWRAMERGRWNRWVILAITTVVFAVAHFELLRAPLLLAIGLPMGLARLFSGRLPAAIVAHQINNFLPALGLMLLLLGVPLTES